MTDEEIEPFLELAAGGVDVTAGVDAKLLVRGGQRVEERLLAFRGETLVVALALGYLWGSRPQGDATLAEPLQLRLERSLVTYQP